MKRGTDIQTFKRDNLIVAILKEHKGRANAIKSPEICRLLRENGYDVNSFCIHSIITKLIK